MDKENWIPLQQLEKGKLYKQAMDGDNANQPTYFIIIEDADRYKYNILKITKTWKTRPTRVFYASIGKGYNIYKHHDEVTYKDVFDRIFGQEI